MKVDITENKENPLMKRNEVRAVIHHEGGATPSRVQVLEHLSKSLKSNKENIVINKIFGLKGTDRSEAKIAVYKDKKDIPKAIAEKMSRRNKPPKGSEIKNEEAAPVAEEKPKEEPKKEVNEEKKEETKSEEKPKAEEKKDEKAPLKEEKTEAPKENPAEEEKKE